VTLAVSCNLSDGVVVGVDSAFTVSMGGTTKVYDSADKLFALGTKPIGVAMYGAGEFGGRVIGNYMAEFEAKHPEVARADAELAVVAETLRAFFHERYMTIVAPALEKSKGKPFADIPETERPGLGLVIAGFSPGQYLSEVWNVLIPNHINVGSAIRVAGQGEFNSNWFALYEPIFRYWWGYDPRVVEDVANYIGTIRAPLTDPEKVGFVNAFGQRQYLFPVGMMPMPVAVEFVKFLVGLVISHHRFEIAASGVGGLARVGIATYRGGPFKIVS